MDEKWVALRCRSGKTIRLVEDLNCAQVPAWTPMWKRSKRLPRVSKQILTLVPCLPSFVFVPEAMLEECHSALKLGKCPSFSVMQTMGVIARFREGELDHMRRISDVKTKSEFKIPPIGTVVRIKSGAFQGLAGPIVARLKHEALVRVSSNPSMPPVNFPAFLFEIVQA